MLFSSYFLQLLLISYFSIFLIFFLFFRVIPPFLLSLIAFFILQLQAFPGSFAHNQQQLHFNFHLLYLYPLFFQSLHFKICFLIILVYLFKIKGTYFFEYYYHVFFEYQIFFFFECLLKFYCYFNIINCLHRSYQKLYYIKDSSHLLYLIFDFPIFFLSGHFFSLKFIEKKSIEILFLDYLNVLFS